MVIFCLGSSSASCTGFINELQLALSFHATSDLSFRTEIPSRWFSYTKFSFQTSTDPILFPARSTLAGTSFL
eukprot:snap_masked-scaffold_2-processed-gene-13.8-mRNA-1 protein AED:1.00 eAED:1.00 QI:0/0/0/0/1/1/2/0/71